MNVAPIPTPPTGAAANAPESVGALEMLAGLPVADGDLAGLAEVRLTPAVAAALRAALDWLGGEAGFARPLRARADDAALELVLEHLDGRALRPAGTTLAAVGGSVGRVESTRPDAPWMVRVPWQAAREQYLMVVEGDLPVALPWSAVIHIVMAGAEELAAGLSAPRAPALGSAAGEAPGEAATGELPVVLLGHGIKRGYYVADRLVWRLPAVPVETVDPPPLAGLTHAVQTEEGDCYWVADPAWLLASVADPALDVPPPPAPSPASVLVEADVDPIALALADVEPLHDPAPPRVSAPVAAPARPTAPEPPAVSPAPEPVAPPTAPPAEPPAASPAPKRVAPPPPPAAAPPAAPAAARVEPPPPPPPAQPAAPPAPARVAPAPASVPVPSAAGFRAALIAEDSLTASIFLARLLEQQGFLVRTVDRADALAAELARGDWALVCVDVELPDGRGREHLRAAREAHERAQAARPTPGALVALVRDAEDVAEAKAAGISRTLRKPFDRGALEQLLARVGGRAGGAA